MQFATQKPSVLSNSKNGIILKLAPTINKLCNFFIQDVTKYLSVFLYSSAASSFQTALYTQMSDWEHQYNRSTSEAPQAQCRQPWMAFTCLCMGDWTYNITWWAVTSSGDNSPSTELPHTVEGQQVKLGDFRQHTTGQGCPLYSNANEHVLKNDKAKCCSKKFVSLIYTTTTIITTTTTRKRLTVGLCHLAKNSALCQTCDQIIYACT